MVVTYISCLNWSMSFCLFSYAETNDFQINKPVERAWNLLKAKDQENLQKVYGYKGEG